jgi:hypothetical protein
MPDMNVNMMNETPSANPLGLSETEMLRARLATLEMGIEMLAAKLDRAERDASRYKAAALDQLHQSGLSGEGMAEDYASLTLPDAVVTLSGDHIVTVFRDADAAAAAFARITTGMAPALAAEPGKVLH